MNKAKKSAMLIISTFLTVRAICDVRLNYLYFRENKAKKSSVIYFYFSFSKSDVRLINCLFFQ